MTAETVTARGKREGELDEQRAGETALKADGHEHGQQHHRHRNDGSREFARRQAGGGDAAPCRLPDGG